MLRFLTFVVLVLHTYVLRTELESRDMDDLLITVKPAYRQPDPTIDHSEFMDL